MRTTELLMQSLKHSKAFSLSKKQCVEYSCLEPLDLVGLCFKCNFKCYKSIRKTLKFACLISFPLFPAVFLAKGKD